MTDQYTGEIRLVGFNFAPVDWAFCDGSLLPIDQYAALFNLLGTTYGGDGQTTFALPDLRGRAPIHMGQGNGLSNRIQGQQLGEESVTLTTNQMPSHSHPVAVLSTTGTTTSAQNSYLAGSSTSDNRYSTNAPTTTMNAGVLQPTSGGSQPHENREPLLVMNYIIALYGIYPSQG
jgi:microcystin-dependent protein